MRRRNDRQEDRRRCEGKWNSGFAEQAVSEDRGPDSIVPREGNVFEVCDENESCDYSGGSSGSCEE